MARTENCDYGGEFKSIEAVDASTVKSHSASLIGFPLQGSLPSFAINDGDYLKATGGGGDLLDRPNGTGPYNSSNRAGATR